jgi:hypothetical protein
MGISPEYFLDQMSLDEMNELLNVKFGIKKEMPKIKMTPEQHRDKLRNAEKWLKDLQ